MRNNPIKPTVDFEQDGVRHGFLKLPHSHDASAWGSVMIPVTVAKNGDGPTALLTGGNHGDEYEGPIALLDLAAGIDPASISGRVIIVPGMNYPAFAAGLRNSPIDGLNMNRVFPGRPDGSATEKIADYFQRTLLPMADFVLDFHSGGKSLDCLPFAATHILDDKDQQDRCAAAMRAFGAPYSVMLLDLDPDGMYDTAAERMGKVFVTTELGGGGTSTPTSVATAKRGVANFLKHARILTGEPEPAKSINLEMPGDDCFIVSETAGMVEHCVDLGERVEENQVVARVHDIMRTGSSPAEYRARIRGILIIRRNPGLTSMGDMLGTVAVPT